MNSLSETFHRYCPTFAALASLREIFRIFGCGSAALSLGNTPQAEHYKEGTKMLGLETLDVLIGLITVYLSFAMACTVIVEAMASWLNVRSKNLEAGLNELFAGELKHGKKFVDAFYGHPLVLALSKGDKLALAVADLCPRCLVIGAPWST